MEVRVENLRKFYGKIEALKRVSLSFVDGGLTAILGPSGCGKTTLLRCIAGFLDPDDGAIYFGQENVTGIAPRRAAPPWSSRTTRSGRT